MNCALGAPLDSTVPPLIATSSSSTLMYDCVIVQSAPFGSNASELRDSPSGAYTDTPHTVKPLARCAATWNLGLLRRLMR